MTVFDGGLIIKVLALAFGIHTKRSFLEYQKQVVFQYGAV
jgi:hypothetical protein